MIQQPIVLAGPISHYFVIAAHDGGGLSYADAELERQEITLARGFFRKAGIDDGAAGLLIIQSEVLDVTHDVVFLDTAYEVTNHHAGKQWIFAGVLEQPAIARVTRKICAATNRLTITLRPQFTPDDVPV